MNDAIHAVPRGPRSLARRPGAATNGTTSTVRTASDGADRNRLLKDDEVQKFIQVNEHDGILWFNKESLDELLFWLMLVTVVEIGSSPQRLPTDAVKEIEECHGVIQKIQEAETKSEYQVEKILMAAKGD